YEGRVIALTGRRELKAGEPMVLEKVAAMFTSLDWAAGEPVEAARRELRYAPSFDELLALHEQKWDQNWQRFFIDIVGHSQLTGILRFHLFQLLQTVSQHSADLDA